MSLFTQRGSRLTTGSSPFPMSKPIESETAPTMRHCKLFFLALLLLLPWLFRADLSRYHTHVELAPTCTKPGVCTLCHHIVSPPQPHHMESATCDTPAICGACGLVLAPPHGHWYKAATCTEPVKCYLCGRIAGKPKGHSIVFATCTTPTYCTTCRRVFEKPLEHTMVEASCTESSHCSRCGETFGKALGHKTTKATCTEPHKCTRCGKTFGKPLGHDTIAATCTSAQYCRRCEKVFSPALGHKVTPATCSTAEYCVRCNAVFAPAKGHAWHSSVLTQPACTTAGQKEYVCATCGKRVYEAIPALGHQYVYVKNIATCTVCRHQKVQLNVEMIYQGSRYPNGCESVSTVMVLRYMGIIDISVDDFIENHLPMSPLPRFAGNTRYAENPTNFFIGDPRLSSGYYCFAPAIGKAINSLINTSYHCTVHTGETLESLCAKYINNGVPVILWATLWMAPCSYTGVTWQINGTGETHYMLKNLHCVVLTGYDEWYYYINDPLNGQVAYEKSKVNAAFQSIGSQAVTVSKGG